MAVDIQGHQRGGFCIVPLYVMATGHDMDNEPSVIVSNVLQYSAIDVVLTKVHRKKEVSLGR